MVEEEVLEEAEEEKEELATIVVGVVAGNWEVARWPKVEGARIVGGATA